MVSEDQPIEWPLVQTYGAIGGIDLWLRRLPWLHARNHLIEKLSNKTKSIDLVIVLAGWEAQQLSFELRKPRSIVMDVESFESHAAPNGLGSYRFVTPGRELLAIAICFAFSLSLIESRSNASTDLALLLSPADRFPFKYKVAEGLDPFIR